jgi:hypothetical protein
VSAVKRIEFISDRKSYIGLRVRWCDIIVLDAHAPTEKKRDESKESFCRIRTGVLRKLFCRQPQKIY